MANLTLLVADWGDWERRVDDSTKPFLSRNRRSHRGCLAGLAKGLVMARLSGWILARLCEWFMARLAGRFSG